MGCFFQLQLQSQAELMACSSFHFSWCLCFSEVEMINEPFIFLHICPKWHGPICQQKFHIIQKWRLETSPKGTTMGVFSWFHLTQQFHFPLELGTLDFHQRANQSQCCVSASSPECSTQWILLGTPCMSPSCWSEFWWPFWGKWHGSDL